ncbi:hypothetical protein J3F84DRAFT_236582 [Trichoderma pleuroticola]
MYRVMQVKNPPAHDMWLNTLKAAPTCGAQVRSGRLRPASCPCSLPQKSTGNIRAGSAAEPKESDGRWPHSASRLTALRRALETSISEKRGVYNSWIKRERRAGEETPWCVFPIKLSKTPRRAPKRGFAAGKHQNMKHWTAKILLGAPPKALLSTARFSQ